MTVPIRPDSARTPETTVPIRPDAARTPASNATSAPPSSAPETERASESVDAFEFDDSFAELDEEIAPLDEEIAAYLDGELDAEERAAFERRLDDDAELRARVDAERSAWNALSLLDVDAPDKRLPDAVVERLDNETQTELQELGATLRRRRAVRFALFGSTALLLAFLGFVVFSAFFPDLQTRRKRDFRVVERLAQLEIVGDFDYLTALDASGFFDAPAPPFPVPNAPEPSRSDVRFPPPPANVGDAPPKSFTELSQDRVFYRLQQKFERLDAETQNRRRALYRQIVDAPNAERLWDVLDQYCAWFSAWPSDNEREKLLAAPIPERLEIVRRRRAERQRDVANRFAPASSKNANASERRDESPRLRAFRDALPQELRDENLEAIGQKYDEFLRSNREYDGQRESALAFLTEESSEKIVAAFSENARAYLRGLSEEERSAALGLLVTLGFWEREERSFKPTRPFQNAERDARPFARPFGGTPLFEKDARRRDAVRELAETLRKAPPELRDYLTSRPADEMRGALWAVHWRLLVERAQRPSSAAAPPNSVRNADFPPRDANAPPPSER